MVPSVVMHSKVTEKITPEKQLTPLDSAIAGNSGPLSRPGNDHKFPRMIVD